jgi:hypothetical protein
VSVWQPLDSAPTDDWICVRWGAEKEFHAVVRWNGSAWADYYGKVVKAAEEWRLIPFTKPRGSGSDGNS